MRRVSAANGNVKVYGVYNPSYGLALDLLRSLYLNFGGLTESSYMLADLWKQGAKNGKTTIIHSAHSQGSQDTWAARRFFKGDEKEVLKSIEVTTYGGAELIPEGVFKKAKNYVSTHDGVPFISSPHRYIQAKRGRISNVHFLKSDSFAFTDHAWDGNTYDRQMRQRGSPSSRSIFSCGVNMRQCLLFLLLTACSFGYQEPAHIKRAHMLSARVWRTYQEKNQLVQESSGGGMSNGVDLVCCGFVGYRKVDIDEGRRMFLEGVESLCAAFNDDPVIRPYLYNYPFVQKNIRTNALF